VPASKQEKKPVVWRGVTYDDEDAFEMIKKYYRNVFSTTEGNVVLNDILKRCKFFSMLETEEDRIRNNVGKEIIELGGGKGNAMS